MELAYSVRRCLNSHRCSSPSLNKSTCRFELDFGNMNVNSRVKDQQNHSDMVLIAESLTTETDQTWCISRVMDQENN